MTNIISSTSYIFAYEMLHVPPYPIAISREVHKAYAYVLFSHPQLQTTIIYTTYRTDHPYCDMQWIKLFTPDNDRVRFLAPPAEKLLSSSNADLSVVRLSVRLSIHQN